MKSINLNEYIYVKLTDLGKDIYYHQYDWLNDYTGKIVLEPKMPEVDDKGRTRFLLWEFMHLYGEHLRMAAPNVIEPVNIWIDEKSIKG